MINNNGVIEEIGSNSVVTNRGFLYGDAVFETLKVVANSILFFEDHYFRLMAAMRIVRMEIPHNFTLEFLEEQILNTVKTLSDNAAAHRVRITVYRDADGFYTPTTNAVGYTIVAAPLTSAAYSFDQSPYEIELYKDFFVPAQLTSTIKTTNKIVNVMASIFAKENDYDNCLLINEKKNVVEAINGNVFILKDGVLITPPLSEGCIKGIMRKQVLEIAKQIEGITVEEAVISPFDLQKSQEVFITNIIKGLQPVTQYRKQTYITTLATKLVLKLNEVNGLYA